MKKVGLGIVVVFLLVIVGGFVMNQFGGSAQAAQVGDCAHISGVQDSPKYTALGCEETRANVKIAKILPWNESKCPTGGMDYSTYTGDATYCLVPNFKEGACYGQDAEAGIAKVDCATKDAVKVVRVLNDKADRAACGEARAAVFPEPATTFCLERGDKQP